MKVSKFNQSKFSIKIKNLWTHMIYMHTDLNISLISYDVKIITFHVIQR